MHWMSSGITPPRIGEAPDPSGARGVVGLQQLGRPCARPVIHPL